MKIKLAAAMLCILWGSFLACGCDDIYEPMEKPVLKPKENAKKSKEDKKLTVLEMKQHFNFIVNMRQQLRNYANQVNLAKKQGESAFNQKLTRFELNQNQWLTKLQVRQEKLEQASNPDDLDLPVNKLVHAARLLKREIKLYYHNFKYGTTDFDPSVDKKLLDTLDEVRHQLQKLEEEKQGENKKE